VRCLPASICLLITERCNARCFHCDIRKSCGQENSPSTDQWKAVLDTARWLGPVEVVVSGGEAFVSPN